MRKLLIALIIVVVVIVVIVLALPMVIDVNQYRGQIQTELQKQLNRPVQLGNMSLRVIPLAVKVDNVTIGDDPSFRSNAPFAQVQQLDVSVKLLPLLSKNIEVNSLTLERPKIELIRNAAGAWNFSTIGHNAAPSAAPQRPAPAPKQQPQPTKQEAQASGFSLSKLAITDGQIAVTDYQKHQSRAVYDHIDLTLKDFAPSQPFSVDVAAHLPGKGTQTLRLTGKGGPVNDAQLVNTPFTGTVKLDEVSLAGAQKFLNTQALENSDAVITGSTDFSTGGGKASAKGSLKLNDAVIHGVQVGYPIQADFNVADDLNSDVIQISECALKLGSTPISLKGTVNTKPNPAIVDVNVSASNASIQEMARLASAFGVAFSPDTKIAGQVTANLHAQGPTDHLAMNGNVNARDLEVTGKDIPQAVKVPAIDLAMTPQDIRSNNFTVTSGGTTLNGQMNLTQYATPSPYVDATMKTVNAKLEELLGIAKAYGVTAAEGMSGSGNVSIDLHATGPIKNTNAMNFSGTGALQNVSLKTPSLTQPVHVKNANLQFTQNSANLTNFVASLGSTNANGNVSIANFDAPNLRFALNIDKVNVAELEKITGSGQSTPAKKIATNLKFVENAEAASSPSAKPGFLETATGSGTVAVGSILYDKTELTNVHSNVNLNHGVIELSPLTAQVYGGQINGVISMDERQPTATFAVNAKLTGADANKLMTAAANSPDTLYGTLAANVNQTFATPPSGDVVQTLNGPFNFVLTNGKLTKVDLIAELSKIGKFGGGAAKGYTAISQMSGTFLVLNGVAQTNDLKAALDVGTMSAEGALNLVNQTLNMHTTAVLSKAYSQSVGGTAVGGYLNTALANKNGELVFPVIISGPMNHPRVMPDVAKIAQMKLDNIIPTAAGVISGKNTSVGGIIGGLLGGGQPQPQQPAAQPGQHQNQQSPNNTLNNALQGILGGKKQKQ
jgi:AsmA protein